MNKQLKLLTLVTALGFSGVASAASISVNFDALDASVNPVTGSTLANYLADYGITVSGVTAGITTNVFDVSMFPAPVSIATPSLNNIFATMGDWSAYGSETFTLNFSNPVNNFGFTRVGVPYSLLGPGTWAATAYNASNQSLGGVGENLLFNYGESPSMQTFAMNFQGISHVTFWGNDNGMGGFGTPPLDNLTFETSAVPIPAAAWLFGSGLLGLIGFARCKRHERHV